MSAVHSWWKRNFRQGLTYRPISETVRDILDWWATEPRERRDNPMRAGLTAERESQGPGAMAQKERVKPLKIVCTYCSAAKRTDAGLLPAVRRYQSERIVGLAEKADSQGMGFLILSGKYGFVGPEHPLPYYDHLLLSEEVEGLCSQMAVTLCRMKVTSLEYHTAAPELVAEVRPYLAAVVAACARASVALRMVILAGNPV
jgi:hypothetical protein